MFHLKSYSTAAKRKPFRLLHKVAKLIVSPKRTWQSHVKGCPLSSPSSLAFVNCGKGVAMPPYFNNKVYFREEGSNRKDEALQQRDTYR